MLALYKTHYVLPVRATAVPVWPLDMKTALQQQQQQHGGSSNASVSTHRHLHHPGASVTTLSSPRQRQQQNVPSAAAAAHNSTGSCRTSHQQQRRRHVVARMYKAINDELADRTREVWDDEEDVQAAAAQLGYDKDSLAADSGPLMSTVNQWYVEQQFPKEGFLAQLELRFVPGQGYGLYATQAIPSGTVLAVCLPLAWVSGPPGQPPPLESLVALLRSSRFSAQQRRVLGSLCSSPDLDAAHEEAMIQQQQELQQVRVCVVWRGLKGGGGGRGVV